MREGRIRNARGTGGLSSWRSDKMHVGQTPCGQAKSLLDDRLATPSPTGGIDAQYTPIRLKSRNLRASRSIACRRLKLGKHKHECGSPAKRAGGLKASAHIFYQRFGDGQAQPTRRSRCFCFGKPTEWLE